MELLDCTQHEQMPVAASAGRAQPLSSPEEMASKGPSTDYIKKAADTLCFEIEESTSGTSDLLTVKLQETPELEGQSLKENTVEVPAVSEEVRQIADESLMSKAPLNFKTERPEEHSKPTRVKVEELKTPVASLEAKRFVYEEIVDSHKVLQHVSHVEMKVVARQIEIEEPSRLVIRRKLPEEVLRVEMLKHMARVDDLALEMFHGHTVSAINVLFEDSLSELTRTLGIRTCAESPAMLTKRSHVTALRVVATRTQVLHTDTSSITGQLRKIAATKGYEEWGE
ncbi:hypothetical protein M404DRAFT_20914 [Pisolithus tinctorius Marx 270]|uniref:Uncharacterized protein n=1 Tax=Pisolithus tinctorius Marx 270 TaxID=870435 RepID=A0A0C3KM25_PISTI|nr:hypothetical protein M404DRAFT_20914 [Pisolithus tinctorius Marx 270]